MLTPPLGDIFAKCLAVAAQWSLVPASLSLLFSMLILRSSEPPPTFEQKDLSSHQLSGEGGIRNLRIRWTRGHIPGGRGWLGGGSFSVTCRLVEGCLAAWLINPRFLTPSFQFLPPKKESACEKRGLRGPGVTTASPAPLPAWVRRRTLAVTPPPPVATSPSSQAPGLERWRRWSRRQAPWDPLTSHHCLARPLSHGSASEHPKGWTWVRGAKVHRVCVQDGRDTVSNEQQRLPDRLESV